MIDKLLAAGALCLAAVHAQAHQPPQPPQQQQPAAGPETSRVDAADAAVPATRYVSPLAGFRAGKEPAVAPATTWAESNAIVAGQGGHGMHGMDHRAPSHPEPATKQPEHGGHAGHQGHQVHQGHQGHQDHQGHHQHQPDRPQAGEKKP